MQPFIKNHPVKHTVDQVTQRTGIYQSGTNNKALAVLLSHNLPEVPGSKNHRGQAEKGQDHFAGLIAKFPAPGHARIFNKMKPEPICPEYPQYFTRIMGRFNPDFQGLVSNDNEGNKEGN